MLELYATTFVHNNRNITSNLPQFDTIWESLMDSVVTKASNGSSTLKYATRKVNFTASKTIYALTQCNPKLAHNDCDSCLRELASFYKVCCHQKQGARIQNPNCWLGWDLHGFYVPNPATTALSLSPPLALGTPLTIIKEDKEDTQEVQLLDLVSGSVPHENLSGDFNLENVRRSLDFPSIRLDILQATTNNFCDENKLG
ncbi:hypothetical protein Gogos_004806 [Gossypium gossypioides]|uniref:Gnk2-homologous domain-containing protein n=1 Tax=Gossypium gossypioides TaxID=34282 RepID=A0A7J9CIJ0_GOSGO|nr:hypothetical protein [Gossypium gossypioides]